ncbi:MAG TPA: hypothetical protein VNO43_08255, partial [Candidatus Eisenbacteria bacterium]|nr:hypothetical protein [Candidatus Eisenbacteria bacterium]
HRAKIFAIKDALNKFGDRVVYCDTDTYFIHSPELLFARIRPGVSFMHACEGPLDQANGADLAAFLNRAELRTVAGRRWNITDDAPMFNAGVVGMHKADVALLDDVAHLTDQIYPHVRIHTVEQFAFSMCLHERTRLCEAHEVVCHYWRMPGRARFQEELRRVLHDPSIASDEERWQRLTAHRPAQNITPLRRTMRERIRSTLKRGAKRVGVLEQVRFVMNKIRGSDAA